MLSVGVLIGFNCEVGGILQCYVYVGGILVLHCVSSVILKCYLCK